jgi:myb proto-oncogene protein
LGKYSITQSKEEDQFLIQLVLENGAKNWSCIAKKMRGRMGKQCRERWHNHLNPEIKKQKWTEE